MIFPADFPVISEYKSGYLLAISNDFLYNPLYISKSKTIKSLFISKNSFFVFKTMPLFPAPDCPPVKIAIGLPRVGMYHHYPPTHLLLVYHTFL